MARAAGARAVGAAFTTRRGALPDASARLSVQQPVPSRNESHRGEAEERAATALGVQRGDAVRSSLRLRLPEHIVGDFAVIPTLHVHATMRRAQLGGGLGVGGRLTRAVRIRSPGRLTYRAHADSARAGTRTGGRNQAQQHHERDPQELRSLIHSLLQLVRFGMTCTRICGCDADRGMRATQIDSFRKNSLGLYERTGPRRPRSCSALTTSLSMSSLASASTVLRWAVSVSRTRTWAALRIPAISTSIAWAVASLYSRAAEPPTSRNVWRGSSKVARPSFSLMLYCATM